MSAQLAVASCAPGWRVDDCLNAVEDRCRKFIAPASDTHNDRFDESARAAAYHLDRGGQQVRAKLALDAARHLGLSAPTAITLASTCELLHNASLIHDDLQDRDNTRRGGAAVWKTFGEATAICTGDLLLSAGYACLAELDDRTHLAPMLSLVHTRIAEAIQGQTADVAHRTSPVEDVATYLRIVAGKSGALLSLPLELALLAARQHQWSDKAREAAQAFAIGYQIADDLNDIDKDAGSDAIAPTLNLVLLLRRRIGSGIESGIDTHTEVDAYCIALARHHLTPPP